MTWTEFTIIGVAPQLTCAVLMIFVAARMRARGEDCWRIVGVLSAMSFGIAVELFLFGTHRIGRDEGVRIGVSLLITFLAFVFADPFWRRRQRRGHG